MRQDYAIRPMRREDVDVAIDWAAAEGWNPGLADAGAFFAADPHGFLIGELDGEPAACISAVAYDGTFGFIGFYIVREDLRGRGLGLPIWRAAMERLAGRTVGLDAVVEQQTTYARSGFALAFRSVRFASDPAAPGDRAAATRPATLARGDVVDLRDVPYPEVAAYDRAGFPTARDAFLRAWIAQPGATALGLRRNGRLAGYGVLRPCRTGAKIGPLFADDAEAAAALFERLCAAARAGPVHLDVPLPNAAAVALAERRGMTPVFETGRMYRGADPGIDLGRVFGVTTFELG